MNRIRAMDTSSTVAGIAAMAAIVYYQKSELWFADNGTPISPDDIDNWGDVQIRRLVDDVLGLAVKEEAA